MWDGEGWPRVIAEGAGGKSALTKKVGNIFWHVHRFALFNFAILREIKNGYGTVGLIYWADSHFLWEDNRWGAFMNTYCSLCIGSPRIATPLLRLSEFIRCASVSSSGTKTWYIMTCTPRWRLLWSWHQHRWRRTMMCLHEKGIGVDANTEIVTVCQISFLRGWLKQTEIQHIFHLLVFHCVEAVGTFSCVRKHLHCRDWEEPCIRS